MNTKITLFFFFLLSSGQVIISADASDPLAESKIEEKVSSRSSDSDELSDAKTVSEACEIAVGEFLDETTFLRCCIETPEEVFENIFYDASKKTVLTHLEESYKILTTFAPDWMKRSPLCHARCLLRALIFKNIVPNNNGIAMIIYGLRRQAIGKNFVVLIEDVLSSLDNPYKKEDFFTMREFVVCIKKIQKQLSDFTNAHFLTEFSKEDYEKFYNFENEALCYSDRYLLNQAVMHFIDVVSIEAFEKVELDAVENSPPALGYFDFLQRRNRRIEIENIDDRYEVFFKFFKNNNVNLYIALEEIQKKYIPAPKIVANLEGYTKAFQALIKEYFKACCLYGFSTEDRFKDYLNHLQKNSNDQISEIDSSEQGTPRFILLNLIASACETYQNKPLPKIFLQSKVPRIF